MALGAALSEQSSGESVSHFSSIRIRVVGIGLLKLSAFSLDNLRSKSMVPLTMAANARFSPTRIVNFVEQRATFEIKTVDKGERFRINRIIIFSKELYKSYPGS